MQVNCYKQVKNFINQTPINTIFRTQELCSYVGEHEKLTKWKKQNNNPYYRTHTYKSYFRRVGVLQKLGKGEWKVLKHIPKDFNCRDLELCIGYHEVYKNESIKQQSLNKLNLKPQTMNKLPKEYAVQCLTLEQSTIVTNEQKKVCGLSTPAKHKAVYRFSPGTSDSYGYETNLNYYETSYYKYVKTFTFDEWSELYFGKPKHKQHIGYQLKKEYRSPQQEKRIMDLIIPDKSGWNHLFDKGFPHDCEAERIAIDLGVLDLWFEEVFETKPQFKEGDYVVCIEQPFNGSTVKKGEINKITQTKYLKLNNGFSINGAGNYENCFRLATPQEIETYTTPTIAGYKANPSKGSIAFGCKEFTREEVQALLIVSKIAKNKLGQLQFIDDGSMDCSGAYKFNVTQDKLNRILNLIK